MVSRGEGMIHRKSSRSFAETVAMLQGVLADKKIPLLAVIDHARAAEEAGLAMRPTQLFIFGKALTGTPLMLAAPTAALDLPLKALIWQDSDEVVWISYNSAEFLRERHGFPPEFVQNIAGLETIVNAAAEK